MIGGGRVFGPVPRDYGFKLNKQTKRLARKSALSAKIKDNAIVIVENIKFDAPKTKDFVALMKDFNIENKKSLLVLSKPGENVYLSARNIQNAQVVISSDLNTYRILNSSCLLITEDALADIENNLN